LVAWFCYDGIGVLIAWEKRRRAVDGFVWVILLSCEGLWIFFLEVEA
jgi:hypothetical protein